jgi:hypothetical protein
VLQPVWQSDMRIRLRTRGSDSACTKPARAPTPWCRTSSCIRRTCACMARCVTCTLPGRARMRRGTNNPSVMNLHVVAKGTSSIAIVSQQGVSCESLFTSWALRSTQVTIEIKLSTRQTMHTASCSKFCEWLRALHIAHAIAMNQRPDCDRRRLTAAAYAMWARDRAPDAIRRARPSE